MNQGRAIANGHPPWVKIVLNYATPFVVSSLGYLAARRRRNVERLVALLADPPAAEGAGGLQPASAERAGVGRRTLVAGVSKRGSDHGVDDEAAAS